MATENEPVNTTIGKVFAEDKDIGKNAEITYSITGRSLLVVSVIILNLIYYEKIIPSNVLPGETNVVLIMYD